MHSRWFVLAPKYRHQYPNWFAIQWILVTFIAAIVIAFIQSVL